MEFVLAEALERAEAAEKKARKKTREEKTRQADRLWSESGVCQFLKMLAETCIPRS